MAAILDLPGWEREYHVIGAMLTPNGLWRLLKRSVVILPRYSSPRLLYLVSRALLTMDLSSQKSKITLGSIEKQMDGKKSLPAGTQEMSDVWSGNFEDTIKLAVTQSLSMIRGTYEISAQGKALKEVFLDIKSIGLEEYLTECFSKNGR